MRQKRLLLILLAVLVLSSLYALWATPRSEKRAPVPSPDRPTPALRPQDGDEGQWQGLRIDLLEPEKGDYPGFERDIFGPLFPRPKPKPKPKPKPTPQPEKSTRPIIEEPPQFEEKPEIIQQEMREALARFTFLGFLDKGEKRTVFLSSDEEIFLVKKGERFGENDRFVVLAVTRDKLTIRQGDDPRLIVIPLVEQEPLLPLF